MRFVSFPTLSALTASLLTLVTYIYQRRKYVRSVTHQMGLESFVAFLRNGLQYRMAQYIRPRAAARLSLRAFALNRLAAAPSKTQVPATINIDLDLDTMFVPLTALASDQSRLSAHDIVNAPHRRVLLIGDPGSGKSTLLKRIYRDICRNAVISRGAEIPVLVELKNLDSDAPPAEDWLFSLIQREVTTVKTYAGDALFESFVDAGRIVVLFDGLDEVRSDRLETISAAIVSLSDQLARRHALNRIVLTTRRQLYVNLPPNLGAEFDAHLTLEAFKPAEMYEFLRKWPYKQRPAEEAARIFGNLTSQPNIREMCATPLVLAMYVASDQITGGENLAETRPDFYKAVTDELIVRRRGRQIGLTTGLNLMRRNRQRILGRLALEHLLDAAQSRNTLQWSAAVRIVQEEEGIDANAAALRVRELSSETGLFTEERREESLRFIHLTFCEFLAAQAIAQGRDDAWQEIVEAVEEGAGVTAARAIERFAEVIVFATALETNEVLRRKRLRWAVSKPGAVVALRAMLDCQAYDDDVVVVALERLTVETANASDIQRDEGWLQRFRQIAVTLRDRELVEESVTGRRPRYLNPFCVATVGRSHERLQELFVPYIRLDTAGALQMADAMGIDPVERFPDLLARSLDEPSVLAHALAEFSRDRAGTRRWARVLATGALLYLSVAEVLAKMEPQEAVQQHILEEGRAHGWHRSWMTRGSALGAILEGGCLWPEDSYLLTLMAAVPVRTTRRLERLFEVPVCLLPVYVGLVACLALAFLGPYRALNGTLPISIGIIGVFAAILMVRRTVLRERFRGSRRSVLFSASYRGRSASESILYAARDIDAVLYEYRSRSAGLGPYLEGTNRPAVTGPSAVELMQAELLRNSVYARRIRQAAYDRLPWFLWWYPNLPIRAFAYIAPVVAVFETGTLEPLPTHASGSGEAD